MFGFMTKNFSQWTTIVFIALDVEFDETTSFTLFSYQCLLFLLEFKYIQFYVYHACCIITRLKMKVQQRYKSVVKLYISERNFYVGCFLRSVWFVWYLPWRLIYGEHMFDISYELGILLASLSRRSDCIHWPQPDWWHLNGLNLRWVFFASLHTHTHKHTHTNTHR
jgi:hypothetical protein